MRKLRSALLWLVLLNKRILKQPLFLLLLLLFPALVLGVRLAAPQQSTLVTVAVAAQDPDDETAQRMLRTLAGLDSDAIRYVMCGSEDEIKAGIADGTYRLGFLFPADMDALLQSYAAQREAASSGTLSLLGSMLGSGASFAHPILCLTGSNDITAKLLCEHLYGTLYADFGRALFTDFLASLEEADGMRAEELERFADEALASHHIGEDFFDLQFSTGESISDEAIAQHLVSPLRGLLCAVLVLTALSAALLTAEDEKRNRFVWVRPRSRSLLHFFSILIPLLDAGATLYLALYGSGTFTTWQRELPRLLLFLLMTAGFANLLRILSRGGALLSASLPLLLCACLFLTPVFFDLQTAAPLRALQALLPPYLYLRSIHGGMPLWTLAVYATAAAGGSILADRQ